MIEPQKTSLGTVMIVDDAPGNLAVLSDALEEAGYRILVATDGLSALEQLHFIRPDIILLDVVMPGLDGFGTCRQLKAKPETSAIPVIFMTALSELDDLLQGFEEGAVDYLVKPIRHPEVLARIAAQMAQVKAMQRAEQALSHGSLATIAVDDQGRILWLTPAARQWLMDYSEQEDDRVLPRNVAEWVEKKLRGQEKGTAEHFMAQRQNRRFTARLASGDSSGEYLLLLQDYATQWDLDRLQQKLGLTGREAEILMWVAHGKTNREVGEILGSSPRTVNKHLEHIFQKLGVATRAAAVATALDRMRIVVQV
ncbi:MAG: response regulator [Methylococcaceae bacterium]